MPLKPPTFRPGGAPAPQQLRQGYDARRAQAQPWRKWYKLALWCHPVHGLRMLQLARQPYCETCLAKTPPVYTDATVVHHKQDHKGDWAMFIDPANHESACKPCHDSDLQRRGWRGPSRG